jgi:hypothetical protein
VKGRRAANVLIPRFDYIDEDTFDALMADLEQFDADQQVIAVANDLASLPAGESSSWQPLIDSAKETLVGLGVTVTRAVVDKRPQDNIAAPTDEVLVALEPFSSQKPLADRKRSREIALLMLKHVVTTEQLVWFEALPSGALEELLTEWRKASNVSLGESEASSTS